MQLCLDGRVAESPDDGWAEVGIRVRRDDQAEVHDASNDHAELAKNAADLLQSDLGLTCCVTLVDT